MTVAYEGHGVTVHIADALDVLAGIADASVDAVVTDPPYACRPTEHLPGTHRLIRHYRRTSVPVVVGVAS